MPYEREPVIFTPELQLAVTQYMEKTFVSETAIQKQIRTTTVDSGLPQIDVRPYEGYVLMWLARLINARRILEIGTLAGYSATWLAAALPDDGKLITLELEEKHAQVARRNFETAGISHKIDIRVGSAHDVLKTLDGMFDMVFLDADKTGNDAYLTWSLEHVRPGGIIAAHNAFKEGAVTAPKETDEKARAMHNLNQRMAAEPRLLSLIIPAGDGIIAGIVQP